RPGPDDHPAHRQVAGGHALGDGHQVRADAVVLAAEPFAGTAEAADHLDDHQHDDVRIDDALDHRPVGGRGHYHAAGTLDGFGDIGRHPVHTQFEDLLLQLARGPEAELALVHVAALAVPVGLGDM